MTLYLRSETPEGAHTFAPAPHALQLTDFQRRAHVVPALRRKLSELHERYTGPRQRTSADLGGNAVAAAAAIYQTLQAVDPEAARDFQATFRSPGQWTAGPVVDAQGWLCYGPNHERVLDDEDVPVSPSAYRPPKSGAGLRTERQRLVSHAAELRRQADLIDPPGSDI